MTKIQETLHRRQKQPHDGEEKDGGGIVERMKEKIHGYKEKKQEKRKQRKEKKEKKEKEEKCKEEDGGGHSSDSDSDSGGGSD